MVDLGVRAGEQQTLVPVVGPTHQVRRRPIWSVDLEDFAISVRLAHVRGSDDDAVAHCCFHRDSLLSCQR